MSNVRSLERYIARAASSASTIVEQLIFLGSLRDVYTGQYLHEGWVQIASPLEVDRELRSAHQCSFESVLRLPIIELSRQLRFHFQAIGRPELEAALFWLKTEPFRELIPEACSEVLRELFVSQVKTALEVLCRAPDWVDLRAPVALLHSPPGRLPLLPRSN